jgi:DNA-binding PadR family transcriptional regulator
MTPPVFAHGHLRLYLLSLLESSSMHGYEIIQALEEQFGGTYTPSPGTIYPRLAKLEAEKLVSKEVDGRKTVYAITDAGRRELADRRGELDDIESGLTDSVRRLADDVRSSVDTAMRSLRADLAAAAREARDDNPTRRRMPREEAREASSGRFREAEMLVNDFRHQVRTDLRRMAARGEVSEDTVTLLRTHLGMLRRLMREDAAEER